MEGAKDEQPAGSFSPATKPLGLDLRQLGGNSLSSIQECRKEPTTEYRGVSETKGIWMLCVHHPSKENHTLVLLDTEGLGDVEKGNSKNDPWIFALAKLLSSCFIYNRMNTINHQAWEQLHYVTELTELIRNKSPPTSDEVADSTKFVSFFADLIFTVQDFMLQLELDRNPITEEEYLDNALKFNSGINFQGQGGRKWRNIPCSWIRRISIVK
uniref:GB1/RHD3-type G domain-containing protein n=1 Tax=Bos indicus x Bos taurus TaxID=30522 RepID=A0A4W2ENB3_BOBOX